MKPLEEEKLRDTFLTRSEARKKKIYEIIFESNTPAGKAFDIGLIILVLLSIVVVVLESVDSFHAKLDIYLQVFESIFTVVFTAEYLLRLYCSPNPKKYAFSFFGIIDLLATIPLYLGWFFDPVRYLLIVRAFRLIRIFRVFRLFSFLEEGNMLLYSLKQSSRKIFVFFLFVLILVISIGTLMYMLEGGIEGSGFDNIPNSIYWAIVTLTTVGYGDITPETPLGRFLSAVVMLLGYTIIAVPTGIVSASLMTEQKKQQAQTCPHCGASGHAVEAHYCRMCGGCLSEEIES